MKVCIIGDITQANLENFLADAYNSINWESKILRSGEGLLFPYDKKVSPYLIGMGIIRRYYDPRLSIKINKNIKKRIYDYKPDLIITHNNAKLNPETIQELRRNLKIPVVCLAADDPTLVSGQLNYLESISAFSHIIGFDTSMITRMKYYSNTPVFYFPGATNPLIYHPLVKTDETQIENYNSNLSYVSCSYSGKVMGMYRGAILSNLVEFGLKIYGDKNWKIIASSYPNLKNSLKTKGFVNAIEMNKIFNATKIFISIGSPTLIDGISQRVFDIAAAKCFQIAENKKDIHNCFSTDELETFNSIGELKEKITWYLNHPNERNQKAEKAYQRVIENYKFVDLAKFILSKIL